MTELVTLVRRSPRLAWVPAAAVLLGTAWGSNQFTPLLLVYRRALGVSTGTLEAMFGLYALGLIPGLLVAGPLSDARGRRRVVIPAAGISLVASVSLAVAGHHLALLFAGRLLAGVSNGAAFGAGTAWVRELSRGGGGNAVPDGAGDHAAARRAAVWMTSGFALGPLVAGLLAQWAPAPRVIPYLPHIALMALVLVSLGEVPETVLGGERRAIQLAPPGIRTRRFRSVVAPTAPWVFAAPAIAFALLPSVVGADRASDGIALTATIAMLAALAGVLIQPVARRLDARSGGGNRAATTGLLVAVVSLGLGAFTAQAGQIWLLVPCTILAGSAYGLCLVAGLVEIQRLADERALAGLTAAFYVLTYVGFCAPYVLALAAHLASYSVLLAVAAGLALFSAAAVRRGAARPEPRSRRSPRLRPECAAER
jgi:hypothetical protein